MDLAIQNGSFESLGPLAGVPVAVKVGLICCQLLEWLWVRMGG